MTRIVRRTLADGTLKVYEYPRYEGDTVSFRPRQHGDHLYVIRSDSRMVKIGRSGNPKQRLLDLQTASAHRLVLVKILRGRGLEEEAIHGVVKEWRQLGEWFSDTPDFRLKLEEALGGTITFRWSQPTSTAISRARATADVRAACDKIRGRPANTDELAAYEAEDRFCDGGCSLEELNEFRQKARWPPLSRRETAGWD
jgi:hypothetical protein